jgi:hypothetical protein
MHGAVIVEFGDVRVELCRLVRHQWDPKHIMKSFNSVKKIPPIFPCLGMNKKNLGAISQEEQVPTNSNTDTDTDIQTQKSSSAKKPRHDFFNRSPNP